MINKVIKEDTTHIYIPFCLVNDQSQLKENLYDIKYHEQQNILELITNDGSGIIYLDVQKTDPVLYILISNLSFLFKY